MSLPADEPRPPVQPSLEAIRARLDTFTKSERRIAERLLAEPVDAIRLSITELAEQANVGEATVSRFCRRLGLRGFQDLKITIATDLSPAAVSRQVNDAPGPPAQRTRAGSPTMGLTTEMLERTAELLDQREIDRAVDALVHARRIDIFGQGASAITALDAQHGLLRLGLVGRCFMDTHSQSMSAALMGRDDVALAFSHSGSARDVVSAQRLAREHGARTICITGAPRSPLAAASDIILITATEETLVSNLRSKIMQLFVLQRLIEDCARALGRSAEEALRSSTAAVIDKMY